MTAKFITGNSLSVLRTLPSDFFHTAVTSPPYYGLRAYDEGIEVWDADPDCEHGWGDPSPRVGSTYREDKGSFKSARKSRIARSLCVTSDCEHEWGDPISKIAHYGGQTGLYYPSAKVI